MANKRGSGGGIRNLRDYIQRTDREPLVGLEWVLEYKVHGNRSEVFTKYFCDICDLHCDLVPMIEHLASVRHRKLYLGRTFPQLLSLPPATKEERTLLLRQLAMEVEKTEGLRMFKSDPNPRKTTMSNGQRIVLDQPQQSHRLETASQRASRWARALEYLNTFEIDSDMEASTVTGLTQRLTAELTKFSSKLKADPILGQQEPSNRGQPTAPNPGLQNPASRWQQAAPTYGQKVPPTLSQQAPSMLGKQVPPMLGKQVTPMLGKQVTPMLGQQAPSMLGQQVMPMLGQQVPSMLGRQMPSMLGQQVPSMLGQQVPSMLGQQVPSMLGQQVPSMLGQQVPSMLGQQVPSMLGQQMTPMLAQQAQSSLGQIPPILGQQASSILGAPPPFLYKGQQTNAMGLTGGPFVPPIPSSNQSNFGPNLGFPNWPPPPYPPNAQPVPPTMTAGQAPVPDSDAEDAKFFKKLMNLLSVIPEKIDPKTPVDPEPPAAKPQLDQKPPEDKPPKEQPRDIPRAEDPGKQKPLVSQKPTAVPEPSPKPVVSEAKKAQPTDDSLADQNKLLELLLQTRQKSAKKEPSSLGKRNIPDPGYNPKDRDPAARKEALPPRKHDNFPPGPLRRERDQPPLGKDRDFPAPYTRISLSPRSGKERFPQLDPAVGRMRPDLEPDLERPRPDPDLDMLLNLVDLARMKRETDRGRMSPEFDRRRESDRGRKIRDQESDRERRKRSPERRRSPGPRHARGSPERPPRRGEERGRPHEKRPRSEEDFFAPTEEERRERRRDEPPPNLTVDLLKRIRGKDMFTVSAILSEYAEEEEELM